MPHSNLKALLKKHPALRYVFQGGAVFFLQLCLAFALHEVVGLAERYAYLTSLVFAYLLNFAGLKYFVFKSPSTQIPTQFFKMLTTSLASRILEYQLFIFLETSTNIYYLANMILVTAISNVFKYFVFKKLVFGDS